MVQVLRYVGFLFCFAILSISCSKKAATSKVTLALPEWPKSEALQKAGGPTTLVASENITYIVVNISGPGISAPAFWSWDRHDGKATTPPASVDLVVPRGTDRLVQVLVVFESSTGGAMEFHYGDALANLSTDSASVGITIQPIGGVSGDGTIAGRYLRADGSTPTGPVEFRFHPPGKPSMVVEHGFMYGGWFSFFALPEVGFTYRFMPTGEILFANFSTNNATPTATQAKIKVPAYWYTRDGNSSVREQSQSRQALIGFFGPGATGRSVCYSNTVTPLSNHFTSSNTADNSVISWVGSGALDATKAGVVAGGTTTCGAAGDLFKTHLKIISTDVASHEGLLGFEGPFQLQSSGGSGDWKQPVLGTKGTGTVELNWKYVPGVTADDAIGGVAVYYRSGVASGNDKADYEGNGDGINCENISTYGFNFWSDVAAGASDTSGTTTISGLLQTDLDAGKFQAVVCPFLRKPPGPSRFVADGGVDWRAYSGNGMSGGGVLLPATKLGALSEETTVVTSSSSRAQILSGNCHPIKIVGLTNAGDIGTIMNSNSITVVATSPGAGESLYTTPNCSDGGNTTQYRYSLMPPNNYVYLKSAAVSGTVDVQFTVLSGTPLTAGTFYGQYATSQPATKLVTLAPATTEKYRCQPLVFQARSNTSLSKFTNPIMFDFLVSPDLKYFSDEACNSWMGPDFNLPAGQSQIPLFFRYTGAGTSVTVSPAAADANLAAEGATIQAKTVTVTEPPTASHLVIENIPDTPVAEACYPMAVKLAGLNDADTPALLSMLSTGTSMEVTLSATNGLFYHSSCASMGSASITTTIEEFRSRSFQKNFRPTGGTFTITATVTNSSGTPVIANGTFSKTPGPAVAQTVKFGFDSQPWVDGSKSFVGTPFALLKGQPYTLNLRAFTPAGNPVNFSGTLANLNLSSQSGTISAGSFTALSAWAAGVASVTFTPSQSGMISINDGGGGSGLDPNWVSVVVLQPNAVNIAVQTNFASDACQPALVSVEDFNYPGQALPAPGALTVTLSSSSPNVKFHDENDQSCSTGTTTRTLNFAAGDRQKRVFINTSATATTASLSLAVSGIAGISNGSGNIATTGSVGGESNWVILNSGTFRRGWCQGFLVYRADGSGSAVADSDARSLVVANANLPAGTLYSDANCSMALGTLNFGSAESTKTIYVKSEGLSPSMGDLTVSSQSTGGTPSNLSNLISGNNLFAD